MIALAFSLAILFLFAAAIVALIVGPIGLFVHSVSRPTSYQAPATPAEERRKRLAFTVDGDGRIHAVKPD